MSQDPFTRDKLLRPELLFKEILRKGAMGMFKERDEFSPFLFRAIVIAIDVEGGKLENPDASGTVSHVVDGKKFEAKARLGPKNPANSVKARIITDGYDKFLTDDDLRVYWPFFPENISVPIKPGEHVYVVFEDENMDHGLWLSKVPGHAGVNYSPGERHFSSADDDSLAAKFGDNTGSSADVSNDDTASETKKGDKLSSLL